jgi:integrase
MRPPFDSVVLEFSPGDPLECTFDFTDVSKADRAIARDPRVDALVAVGKPAAAATHERTVKASGERFLAVIRGESKPLTFREIRQYLESLTVELGKDADVAVIDEDKVESVFLKLKGADLSQGTKKKRWGFFRRFVEYLAEKKLIGMPGNLYSKPFKFKVETAAVMTYDADKVRAVLKGLTDRQRLYALLGLNAGMTSADVGQLTKDMIRGNKLTRKRVKTDKWDKVPTVTYVLWPETLALLEECGSDHPTLVLTGRTGEALWSSRLEADGRTPQKDMINQQWKRANVAIPHKAFRSIAATALKGHATYSRFVDHFLGHAPKGVAERHYAGEDAAWQADFDRAVSWLRTAILG